MTTLGARCVECRLLARSARSCPDCREPVHQRCKAGHACPPRQAQLAARAAAMQARLVPYHVVLTLEVDSARGSPDLWDWPNCLGLRPPEHMVVEVTHADEAHADPDGSTGATTS